MIFPLNLGFGSGLPLPRSRFAEPASDSDGLRHLPRPFGCAGDLRLGFPSLLMPSALLVSAGFRVAPVAPASSCLASDTVLRLPLVPHLRLHRWSIVESPRFSLLRRCRFWKLQVAPSLCIPGIADDQYPGRPRCSSSGPGWLRFRVTSEFRAIRLPLSNTRIAPSIRFGLRRSNLPQVALVPACSTSPIPSVSSRPETSFLGWSASASTGCACFRLYGWVDDYSLAESNFASPACAVDESSVPIRYQHSWSDFQRNLNLNLSFAIGRPRT